MQKKYNATIDILRVLSILAVICIHTTTRTLEAASYDLQNMPLTLFLNQTSRFAVPLFFMISGFVLELNYPFHASYFSYLKKRLNRIFIPYVFWSFIYFFFVYRQHTENFLRALVEGNASYQLYFIPTLLIFYLLFPLLHTYYRVFAKKSTLLFLGLVQIVLLFYDYRIHSLPFFYPLSIALLNFYIFLLGSIASHHEGQLMAMIKKWRFFLVVLTIILIDSIFLEGKNGYLQTRNYKLFYSQWRPSVLLYTLSLTSLLYYFFNKHMGSLSWIKRVSRLSFFVFFVHVIVLEIIWQTLGKEIFFATHANSMQQLWYDPLFFTLTTLLSFFFAFVVQKIPLLKNVTG